MNIVVVIASKDRHENLRGALQNNMKFLTNCDVLVIDASSSLFTDVINYKNLKIVKAERPGQFNQKIQGSELVRKNYPEASHILFLDDDIHLDREIISFIDRQYSLIPTDARKTVLTIYIKNLQKYGFLEFLRVHSFKSGKLAKNTFTSRNCIGNIQKVEWALGGCSCWPIGFCPKTDQIFPIKGKAYAEDVFLSKMVSEEAAFYSSERTSIVEMGATQTLEKFSDGYYNAVSEAQARKYLCRKFKYFDKNYLCISIIGYSFTLLIRYLCTFNFKKISYPVGLIVGVFAKNIY